MEVRQSVLGEISARSGQRVESIDIGTLVRRLILFDTVIVKSFRLREIPTLVRTFGKNGFLELLSSGALRLSCEFTCVITDIHQNGVRTVPPEHFTFGIADIADREGTLRKELGALQDISGLKNKEREEIEIAVRASLLRPPQNFGQTLLQQIDADLRSNSPALKVGVVDQLKKAATDSNFDASQVEIAVEEPQSRIFRIRNSIAKDFKLTPETTQTLLGRSVTALTNLTQRLAEMQAYSAITGFLDTEAPLLFGKLSGIVSVLNPSVSEGQFKRVIEVAGVPDFKPGQRVDVSKLMAVRESTECRDFRGWLSAADSLSDEEILDATAGVKNRLAQLAGSSDGKALRFAVTTGLGLIPGAGLAVGAAAGLIDSFLVDRVLPRSGIVAFLAEKYPSLFVRS